MARAPHGPTDRAISGLHEAIAAPHRIDFVKNELARVFPRIVNFSHRRFLEGKLQEIEQARDSRIELKRIAKEIDRWNEREFPVDRE